MYITRILSIDPGSKTGVSILDFTSDGVLYLIYSTTLNGEILAKQFKYLAELHGERYAKQHALCEALSGLLFSFKPDYIVAENAFYNPKRPQAYGSLVELLLKIKMTVINYRKDLTLELIDAAMVKKIMKVPGNSGDKSLIKIAIKEIKLLSEPTFSLDDLDEHALDSIAVGYSGAFNLNKMR